MWIEKPGAAISLFALALSLAACGGSKRCSEVDEEALAERVAEIVLERLGHGDADRADQQIVEPADADKHGPEPRPPAPGMVELDAVEDDEEEQEPIHYVPVDGSPELGPGDALVTIVMFADIQCSFCVRAYQTVKAVSQRFDDDVRIVWKNHPLPFHQEAMQSHQALMEARAQQGDTAAFEMLELMFADLTALEQPDLERHAKRLGLSLPRFRKALKKQQHSAAIERDLELADRLGVKGTPTFFINGVKVVGAGSYYRFFHTVSDAMEAASELIDAGVPREEVYAETIRHGRGGPGER